MPNVHDMFPSKWLKASDLQGHDVGVTILSVGFEDVAGDGEVKPIVYFQDKEKGLVLNKTNANTIARLHGQDTDRWTGQRIVLFPSQVDFRGEQVPCIRIRINQPAPVAAPPAEAAPAPAPPVPPDDIPF